MAKTAAGAPGRADEQVKLTPHLCDDISDDTRTPSTVRQLSMESLYLPPQDEDACVVVTGESALGAAYGFVECMKRIFLTCCCNRHTAEHSSSLDTRVDTRAW